MKGKQPENLTHRANLEFSNTVKLAAYNNAGGRCQDCFIEIHGYKAASYHHRISLSAYEIWFSDMFKPEFIRGEVNCRVLCDCCHKKIHSKETNERIKEKEEYYRTIALELKPIADSWQKPLPTVSRNLKKAARRALKA